MRDEASGRLGVERMGWGRDGVGWDGGVYASMNEGAEDPCTGSVLA